MTKNNQWRLVALLAFTLLGISVFVVAPAVLEMSAQQANLPTIKRGALERALAAGEIDLIDIREPYEFAAGHIAGARNLPLSTLDPKTLAQPSDKPIVLVCRSGRRTARTLSAALEAGATNISHYRGGMLDWEGAGKPVVKAP